MNQLNSELKMSRGKVLFLGFVAVAFFSVMFTTSLSAHNYASAKVEVEEVEKEIYSSNGILGNRLSLFVDDLQSKGVEIDEAGILFECSSVDGRNVLSAVTGIPLEVILFHAEIADMVRVGISQEHAQLLLLSHMSQSDPFTKENLNVRVIANSDIVKMKMEVDGFSQAHKVQTIPFEFLEQYQRVCKQSLGIMQYGCLGSNFVRQ